MKHFFFYSFLLLWQTSIGQDKVEQYFTFEEFQKQVKGNHPIALQAEMKLDIARAKLLGARGGFDPKVSADIAQKYFKDIEYYDLGTGKLKIPTWFGLEFEGGYERNEGVFLNPQNNVPTAGLWFGGISVPVGKGLLIDERRAELRKAQVLQTQNDAERRIALNELLFQSGKAYWKWFEAFHFLKIYEDALNLAQIRYDGVKTGAQLGDLPSIDTLEAGIQLQNRRLSLQEARLNFRNQSLELSVYLWESGLIPLELDSNVIPETVQDVKSEINQFSLGNFQDSLLKNHPQFVQNRAKQAQLRIEEKWNKEQLKPELNLKYKPITEPTSEGVFSQYSINNYTWGLQFEFPIFLRKERSKLKLTQLKLVDTELELQAKQQKIIAKVEMASNELETTKGQVELAEKNQNDYRSLLEGERRLFNNGESSLFLINSREVGYINSELKLIEVLSKNQQSKLKINYALGVLN